MKKILADKEIDYLVHFTRAENIQNIFKHGLYPRSELELEFFDYIHNDDYRYDGYKDAVCTSIEFPNYKMFYTLRCENVDTDWVVLAIKAKVIYKFECAFFITNAGSEEMYSTPLEEHLGKEAFLELFEELSDGPSRKELGLDDCYPTNPQAEVLIFDIIPANYIDYVIFRDKKTKDKYTHAIPETVNVIINKEFFYGREDYRYWQKKD